jgi:hypothetical protein
MRRAQLAVDLDRDLDLVGTGEIGVEHWKASIVRQHSFLVSNNNGIQLLGSVRCKRP